MFNRNDLTISLFYASSTNEEGEKVATLTVLVNNSDMVAMQSNKLQCITDINFTGQIYVWIKGQRVGKYSVDKAASNSTTRYIPVTGTLSGITDQNVRCEITVDGGGIYNFMGGFAFMTRSSGSWS